MNQLTQFLVDGILHEAESEVVTAVFGGGFKPPTQGHLEVVLRAIKENPEIDQVYIVVGSGVRNGISQEQSMKIWEKYKPLIPKTTEIIEAGSPLNWIKDYLKDHTEDKTYILIGAREGNEEDEKDLEQRSNLFKKYGGEIKPIFTQGNISGTNARAAAKQSKEAFYPFLPDQLSDSDKEEIYNIILPTLNEVGEGNSKPYEWVEHFSEYFFTTDSNVKYIVSLDEISEGNKDGISIEFSAKTPEMGGYSSKIEVSKGELFRVMATIINILKTYISKDPKVEFILYSPHKKTGEGDINNQRDKLYKAFIKNQLPGAKIKDIGTSTIIAYLPNNSETNDLGETSDPQAGTALPYGSGFAPIKENASYSKDIDVKGKILELTKHMLAKGMNIKPLPKVIFKNGDSSNARDFYGKTAYYNPNNKTITLYTEGRHPKDIVRSFSHEMIHHIQNLENRLGDVSTTNTMEDDNIDKLEQEANLKGTMTFRNWTDSLNESLTKNSNQIYHWTSYSACKKIIESNKLKSNEANQFFEYDESRILPDYKNVVFFTKEDERFADEENSNQCILVVDKSKLFKDYKTISYGDPYEEIVVYTNDPSISVLPYLKGVILMNTLQKSAVKKMVVFLESKGIPYEINDNLEKEVKAKQAKLPTLKKELINKLKSKYPNGFIGYLNTPLISRQTPEYFKDNPTYSYPNITINKLGEYGEKNKFQVKFKIEPQNLEKYINWFMYSPDSIEDLINMDNYEGEELYLKGDIPIDPSTLLEANLKGTMTFRNWTDSLNEDLSNISLDYIKTKLPKLDSYPKSDIILSKGDFVYLEIPQDANNPYSMVYEIKVFDIKDGTLVAQSSFDYDDNNKLKGTLDVRPDKRRMGIATEIYKLAEKIIGDTIFPEEKHTEDAEKFWRQKNRSFGPQNYDSLNEVKYTNPNFELEWEEAVRYPEFKEMGKENWIKVAKQGKLVNYSSIKDVLGNVDLNFDNLEEPKKQRFQSAFKNGTVETPIAVKFSDNDYDLVAGNTRLSGLVKNGEDPKIWIVNISNLDEKKSKDLFGLNQYARELAQGLEEEVFKASKIEKLLKQKYSEVLEKLFLFEKGDYIELNLIKIRPEHKGKGWATKILDDLSEYAQENNKILTLTPSDTFGASKSRLETFYKRFGFVPNKGKNKDFTTRDAMIRPLSEDTSELFTIYLDMDGVITDFDKKFVELAGMGPREYENSFGTEKFWDFIDIKHKVKFFSEMEWMPEGKKLYDFVKQFDHKLLSAPSKNDASKIGKRMWRKANTPDTQLILSAAVNKQNYADKSNILIDDREKNIQQWRDAGGIGILFKSTDQVIDELKKIMNL
jgi:GNAT superfamily N-acetyltransferase/phosphopantetheine adenylyltransferase